METLKAVSRKDTGSRSAGKLRQEGLIPGVIYGHGEAPEIFAVSEHDLAQVLAHGEQLVQMSIEGKEGNYLIKDIQRDTFGLSLLHVDLARVNLDERVEVAVPVVLWGDPVGAEEGGVLVPGAAEVEVECVVTNIPEEIRVSVKELKIGDALTVADLPAIEGVTILTEPETPIASCTFISEEPEEPEEAEEDEEGAEPEVIGKGKEEDQESDED